MSTSHPPAAQPADPDGFAEAWAQADPIPGWLTREQALLLYTEARRAPRGSELVEIGSHQGRSTVILGRVAAEHQGRVVAIDPFIDGRLFGGAATRDLLESHLESADLTDTVELVADYSTAVRGGWTRSIGLLYIDGKHDYWTLSDDLRWTVHLPAGGRVAIHDCFSSIGVTLGILAHVLPGQDLRYLGRAGSLALFERGQPSLADRARLAAQLGWWVRNVFIKVLLRLRLRTVARSLGHDSPYDPY